MTSPTCGQLFLDSEGQAVKRRTSGLASARPQILDPQSGGSWQQCRLLRSDWQSGCFLAHILHCLPARSPASLSQV